MFQPSLSFQPKAEEGGGVEIVSIQPLMWNEIQERRRVNKLRKRLGLRKLEEKKRRIEEEETLESAYRERGNFKVASGRGWGGDEAGSGISH